MNNDTRPKAALSKDVLTKFHASAVPDWQQTARFKLLIKKYGKYIYLPLDAPKISAYNPAAFKEWFLDRATPVYKRKADIANPGQTEAYKDASFLSVDSKKILDVFTPETIKTLAWDLNPVSDMYDVFPEIRQQIVEHLPFKSLEYYSLWSSLWAVSPHRDAAPLCDMPFAFRINLYDENPEGTLSLHKGIPDTLYADCEARKLHHLDSNSLVWNNLRALHSSTIDKKYMKVLMIVSPTYRNTLDLDKLEVVFDRSIEKYKNNLWEDTSTLGDYIHVNSTD